MMRLVSISLLLMLVLGSRAQEYNIQRVNLGDRGESRICPSIYGDGIVFMSNKRSQILKTVKDETGQLPYNLYFAELDGHKMVGDDEDFAPSLRTKFNDGPASFANEGKEIFYSRNIELGHIADSGKPRTLGIFISTQQEDGSWSDPQAFQHNSNEYNISHPAINPSGNLLVFSSTMPGGEGGADLYFSEKTESGSWTKPKNLGSEVNTPGDEVFPTFNLKGDRLFFSSDGRDGFGGLDLYRVSWSENSRVFKNVRNFLKGVNSSSDDFNFTCDSSGVRGYFGSNRNGRDEVFYFERLMPSFKNCKPNPEVNFCYLIQENSIMEDSDLPLKFIWDLGDGNQKQGLAVSHCYSDTGSYQAVLNIVDTTTGEIYYEVSTVAIDISLPGEPSFYAPVAVEVKQELSLVPSFDGLNGNPLEVYWQADNEPIRLTEEFTHAFSTLGEHKIRLGILDESGEHICVEHTINVVREGKLKVNEGLSNKGPTQLDENLGYAVELLNSIKKKALSDPVFDKVDYPITERFDEIDSVYQYTVGESDKVASLYHLYREMKEIGFESRVVSFESNKLSSEGVSEVLVFFSPGKAEISKHNEANLLDFVENLKGDYSLEVLGYADPTGNKEFNKQLSLRRAMKVAEFLENNGVARNLISVKALGAIEETTFDEEVLKFYRKVEVKLLVE